MIQLSFYGNTLISTRRFTHPSKAQVLIKHTTRLLQKVFLQIKQSHNKHTTKMSECCTFYVCADAHPGFFIQTECTSKPKNSTTAVQCTLPPIPFTTNVAFLTEDPNISLMTSFTRKRCSLNYYWMKKGFYIKGYCEIQFFLICNPYSIFLCLKGVVSKQK